jgi:hypothetical protein
MAAASANERQGRRGCGLRAKFRRHRGGGLSPIVRIRSAAIRPDQMPNRVVPRTWIPLLSWEQVQRWQGKGGLILIIDDATDSHFHVPTCEHVAKRDFETMRSSAWKNGAHYGIAEPGDAAGHAVACCSTAGTDLSEFPTGSRRLLSSQSEV